MQLEGSPKRIGWVLALSFLVTAPALSDGIPEPQHPVSSCKSEQDTACLKEWYVEYKSAIIQEYRFWRVFYKDAELSDPLAAERDTNFAIREHAYRHRTWNFFRGETIEGISTEEIEAVLWGCRTAIINLKYWLIGLTREDYNQAAQDKRDYLKSARQCEKIAGHP